MRQILNNILVFSLFLLITSFFLRGLFLSPGVIIGADWGFPVTSVQVSQDLPTSSWTNHNNFLGARQSYLAGMPFQLLLKLATALGISNDIYIKMFLFFVFVSAGISMYSLARFLKLGGISSVLTGVFYITSPVFFNYSIMGWIYVLFAMVLLPLAVKYFIKSVEQSSCREAIITGIIYAVSIVSAQSAISFLIVFITLGFYLIDGKKKLYSYFKTLTIVFVLFFLLNSHWILGLIFFPDRQIVGTSLVKSAVSLGTVAHMTPINILRLFGSLFNYQYEKIMDSSPFSFFSFFSPVYAIIPLLLRKRMKLVITLWIVALIPVLMYLVNLKRDILLYIPMSNIMRDFARFAVLSSFAYSLLSAFSFEYLLAKNIAYRFQKKLFLALGAIFFIVWIFSIFPWWRGDITNWQPGGGCFDIRLRTKIIPDEFLEVEKRFQRKRLDHKGVHLPLGAVVEFNDDFKFKGMCNGVADAFASFSPISGGLGVSDRNQGYTDWYSKRIVLDTLKEDLDVDITDILKPTNIKYFIIRKNFLSGDNKVLKDISRKIQTQELRQDFDSKKVSVFSLLDSDFLPHIFTGQSLIFGNIKLDDYPKLLSSSGYKKRSAVYIEEQTKGNPVKTDFLSKLPKEIINTPVLEYKKISLTKYRVRIHKARELFPLVFSESYHDGWKAYLAKPSNFQFPASPAGGQIANYKILDGNKEDQATKEELEQFVEKGWITTFGDKKKIDFISKNFADTLQNDNLPNGSFYETWFKKALSENSHFMVNSYANNWIINTKEICDNKTLCYKNDDGSYDFEVIIEFWPQRLFYVGVIISLLSLAGSLIYLVLIPVHTAFSI